MFEDIISFIREQFGDTDNFIPLHEPKFLGNERKYVLDAIDSTFVSSVGAYVDRFESMMCEITGASFAVATVNGTSALHAALQLMGVTRSDEVITQPLTFVATANAIRYTGAHPVFVDVDRENLGLSATKLEEFLSQNAEIDDAGSCVNKTTRKYIKACVPMHTFGFPANIDEIVRICDQYHIPVIEDAAESLGSFYKGCHTGTFGKLGIFSFNGNKTVTCGGGGAIITNDPELAKQAKHITTTAKVPHRWEYVHDAVGYNYRMPNLNAALACAQLEQLDRFLESKTRLAKAYETFFNDKNIRFVTEQPESKANYWLNTIVLPDLDLRNRFLQETNDQRVMTRPAWRLMNQLEMFRDCQADDLSNAEYLAERIVNIPSSVRITGDAINPKKVPV